MAKSAKWFFAALLACALAGVFAPPALAQATPMAAPTVHIQVHALPSPGVVNFDPHKSVDAYLARISGKAKARSDAYFEGGYVLSVVDVLYTLVVAGLLLWLRLSAWMRNFAARITRFRFLQVPIYVAQYVVATTLAGLPLAIYEGFVREHAYGLSNQTFLQWSGDFGKSFLVSLLAFTILLTIIYAAARAAKGRWWVWGTGITVAFMVVMLVISPVYIAPLFNHYTQLPESGLRSSIVSMARANGIPADNIYTFDASKQSTRISANVSGFLGTTRISLTDNLLDRCTPSEVLAVLGQEMGHYVMNHVGVMLTSFGLVFLVGFFFVDRAYRGLTSLFGGRWDVRAIDDPAGLPLIMALFSVFMLAATPVTNTIIRTEEVQADIFGLNAVRQPDAFAAVALKVSDYRKLDPSPWEEFIFYDHPSGRTRIWEAMRWKAEHLNDPDILDGPISPQ
jgi:STE24 endopeptidase